MLGPTPGIEPTPELWLLIAQRPSPGCYNPTPGCNTADPVCGLPDKAGNQVVHRSTQKRFFHWSIVRSYPVTTNVIAIKNDR